MKLANTRCGETNVDIHPFLILNMEKSKFWNAIFLCDNNYSCTNYSNVTIIVYTNCYYAITQFVNYVFMQL